MSINLQHYINIVCFESCIQISGSIGDVSFNAGA